MKVKLKSVVAKPNNTSIIIYYSKNGEEMRFPTGISITNNKNAKGKYTDWDYTNQKVRPGVIDFETSNGRIKELLEKGNNILIELYKKGVSPSVKELEDILYSNQKVVYENSNSFITDLYGTFLKMKEEQFTSNGTISSLGDFKTTKNLLNDFEIFKGERYKIFQLDNKWCREMLNFMKNPHEDDPSIGKFYITDGENGAKRCKKVFDIFVQFSQYLKEIKITTQETIDLIKSFRKTNIKVPKTEKVTLNIEEIHSFYDFQFDLEKHNIARDVFVFICLTGLRREDYKHFSKFHIKENKVTGIKVYDKLARKTKGSSGVNYKIPLCDIAVEILEKYDYKPPLPIKINRDIKDALELTGMFDEPTNIIDKKTGEDKLRYNCISLHKGRDSFITNLVDTSIPLNTLLKYTGHTKLSTLQGYIDTSRDIDTTHISIFNRKKNEK